MRPYYDDGRGIVIYHGDCREVLPHVTADVVVTDAPFGISDHPLVDIPRAGAKRIGSCRADGHEVIVQARSFWEARRLGCAALGVDQERGCYAVPVVGIEAAGDAVYRRHGLGQKRLFKEES